MNNFDLEQPVIEFSSENEKECITLRDMCSHLFVVGSSGSGKSSGSLKYVLQRMISYGCGGLVLSVKSEIDDWKEYCRQAGREKDLVVVGIDGKHSFNFLDYESRRESGTNFVSNLVTLLDNVIQANKQKNESHGSDDAFWAQSLRMLMHNCITLNMIAYSKITIPQLFEMALSVTNTSPDSAFEKTLAAAKRAVKAKITLLETRKGKQYLDSLDNETYNQMLFENVPEARHLKLADQFFIDNFRKLSEKTRSIVELSFIGFLFNLLQEPVYSLFCSKPSTITPESCLEGKIILLDLPTKIYGQAAQFAQLIFKEIFMKAMERRNIKSNNRVCILVSDECHELLSEVDSSFLGTARSSRVSVIFATQNLASMHSGMGGSKSDYRVKSLLGNFANKIIHCNTDVESNSWASSLIGQAYQKEESETITNAKGTITTGKTISVKLTPMVRPETFVSLLTGGPKTGYRVTAYLHAQGKKFATGFSHRKITFDQNFKPQFQKQKS